MQELKNGATEFQKQLKLLSIVRLKLKQILSRAEDILKKRVSQHKGQKE